MTETTVGDISAPPSSRRVSLSRKVHRKLNCSLEASAVHHRKVSTSSVADGVTTGCCLRSPDSGNDDEELPGLLMVRLGVCFPSGPVCAQQSSKITLTAATVRPQGKPGVEVNVYLLSVQLHWSVFHISNGTNDSKCNSTSLFRSWWPGSFALIKLIHFYESCHRFPPTSCPLAAPSLISTCFITISSSFCSQVWGSYRSSHILPGVACFPRLWQPEKCLSLYRHCLKPRACCQASTSNKAGLKSLQFIFA